MHVPASLYLSPNYLTGVGAHPTGKRCFLSTAPVLQGFGENIALCRATQQIPGIQEFPPCQSRAPGAPCVCREGRKQWLPGNTTSAIPLQLCTVTPVTKLCTSSGSTHLFRALFLFCQISVKFHTFLASQGGPTKYCELHPNQGNPSSP